LPTNEATASTADLPGVLNIGLIIGRQITPINSNKPKPTKNDKNIAPIGINTLNGIANFSYKNGPILSFNTNAGPTLNTTMKAINIPITLKKLNIILVFDSFQR